MAKPKPTAPTRQLDLILLTAAEAAEQLRVSERTLRRWANVGKLTAYRVGGGLRYSTADLNTLVDSARI